MSKEDKRREKRRLARLQKSQHEKLAQEENESADLEDEDGEFDSEPLRKDYGEAMPMHATPPATSFKELDDYKVMREREEKIRETSYEVQDLVWNILYASPDLSTAEKAEKIKKVGAEFGARVQNVISQDATQLMSDALDLELLAIKAMVATENRKLGVLENIGDWISKKKLTASAEAKLSDDDFAVVYEVDGKKVRKYPIHDKAHVRNALARAAQMMDEGGEAAADAKKALPKIRAAAKKMGIGMAEKSAVIVEKGADDRWRAVMFPSNKFIDWHGDIISEAAHKEYVEWQNENMDVAPLFMTWHLAGTARQNPVDFVGYDNGFVVMSAPLTEDEAAGLLRAQAETDLGMSHTSLVLERDPSDKRVVTKYRTVEVTDLPLNAAANPFTSLDLITKEAVMDTQKYLAALLGSEERANKFLERAGMKSKELEAANIPSKEKGDEVPAEPKQSAGQVPALSMDEVIKKVAEEFGMEQLSAEFTALKEKAEKVETLEALVKELVEKKEDSLAEMIAPKAAKTLSWMNARPSQKSETVIDPSKAEDNKLAESKPSGGWLSELTNTTPIQ